MFRRTSAASGSRRGSRGRAGRLTSLAQGFVRHDPLAGEDATPPASFERTWRASVKQRTVLILAFVACWVVVIEGRLVYLQVARHEELTAMARNQQKATIPIPAGRGDITDRNGRLLAYSVDSETVNANPSRITNPEAVAKQICRALADCSASDRRELVTLLSSGREYARIRGAKEVSPEQVARLRALDLPFLDFRTESVRYHPMRSTAAHVVGSVNAANDGQAGIEYSFNRYIRGTDGLAIAEVNAARERLTTRVERPAVRGVSLELTIDAELQHIVERELEAGVRANRALGGSAIVMDPNNGDVFAMASYPTFDLNAANASALDAQRNRALQDVYEPGSTFKIVTASAAIEQGVLRPTDLIDTNPGWIVIGRRKPIRDTHSYGVLTFEDVIVKSSNVGAIKAGQLVGADRLADYVERFGFGHALTPQLAGESRGLWSRGNISDSKLASLSMGYEVSVTPLQMVTAASAVANGGRIFEPHFVRTVMRDGRREPVEPKVLRTAISSTTAATVAAIMEGVVERGTATTAQVPGYRVAGKTGTAKKVVDGRYSDSAYNASFVGFLPADAPAFTIIVVIDTPRAGTYYGGTVAAPIFQRIAAAAVQRASLPPTVPVESPRPMFRARETYQPVRAVRTADASIVTSAAGPGTMPSLIGMPARDAVRVLATLGLTPEVEGTGFVVAQRPEAGEVVMSGSHATLELRRVLADATAGEGVR